MARLYNHAESDFIVSLYILSGQKWMGQLKLLFVSALQMHIFDKENNYI